MVNYRPPRLDGAGVERVGVVLLLGLGLLVFGLDGRVGELPGLLNVELGRC